MNRGIVTVALSLLLVFAFSPRQGFTQTQNVYFLDKAIKYDMVISLTQDEATTLKRVLVVDVVSLAGKDFLVVMQSNGLANDKAFVAVENVRLIIPSTSNLNFTTR